MNTCVRAENFIDTDKNDNYTVDSMGNSMVTNFGSYICKSGTEATYANSYHVSYHVNRSTQYKHEDLQDLH